MPKVVLMTQTRSKDFRNLNFWNSFINFKKSNKTNFELIINNQNENSEKNTDKKISSDVLVLNTNYLSLSVARNYLLQKAILNFPYYDYFIFIDDDSYIYDYILLIQSLNYCKKRNFKGLIIGAIYKPNLDFINRHMKNFSTFKILRHKHHNMIMGSCICLGKECIDKNIIFDSKFGLGAKFGGSEETELFFNALKNKVKIIYNPCFMVIHPPTYKNQYSFMKMYKYGQGRGAVYKKYLDENKIGNLIHLVYGVMANLFFSFFSLFTFQKSFLLRHLGLLLGKISGFLGFKN